MRLHLLVIILMLGTTVFAGCVSPTPPHLKDWGAEAEAHGAMGQEALFDLGADAYTMVGDGTATATRGTVVLESTPRTAHAESVVFFHGNVDGHGSGLIVIEGTRIELVEGTLRMMPIARIHHAGDGLEVHPAADHPPPHPQIAFPDSARELESDWFFAQKTTVLIDDIRIDDADRVHLLQNGTLSELSLPLRFDADLIGISGASHLRVAQLDVRYERFAYGGTQPSGTIDVTGSQTIHDPLAIFGNAAALTLNGSRVHTREPFRLTQALTGSGYAVPAHVEVHPSTTEVEITTGNITWVGVDHRESGYLGAAVIANVTVTGSAAEVVRLPLDNPPWIVDELWDAVEDAGYLAPFVALPVAIASPFLVFGEAFLTGLDCIVNDCPSERPYPRWIAPGEIGHFYYQVDATQADAGTYEGTIRIEGANHDPVVIPVQVQVHES